MGKVMRHTLGASLNIRHNLSSSKGPKPLQLKLLTTYIPKTSAFTLAFSTSAQEMQQQDNHEYPFLYQRQTCHQVQPNQATYQKRQKCQPATYLQEVLYQL